VQLDAGVAKLMPDKKDSATLPSTAPAVPARDISAWDAATCRFSGPQSGRWVTLRLKHSPILWGPKKKGNVAQFNNQAPI